MILVNTKKQSQSSAQIYLFGRATPEMGTE